MGDLDAPREHGRWFGVRLVYRVLNYGEPSNTYEERVTVWRADSLKEAIELAEREAGEYADAETGISEYLGIAQAFETFIQTFEIRPGDEVFSLMRDSDLEPHEYIDRFFDTGSEHEIRTASSEDGKGRDFLPSP